MSTTDRQIMTAAPADLFAGAAYYFARYQADYPAAMFDFLTQNYLSGREPAVLLDLGCGTGQISVPLARFADEVIAVDPDQGMIDEARQYAARSGARNVSFVTGKSEELGLDIGPASLVTIAGAFHWMDRERVVKYLEKVAGHGCAIAVISRQRSNCSPDDWWLEQLAYTEAFWGGFFPAGREGIRPALKESNDVILARSAFSDIQDKSFPYEHHWDLDSLVGYILSTSKACPGVLGDRRPVFEDGLRSRLSAMSPTGTFIERGVASLLLAARP
ncbi:methyltransferase domain-containing protein [Mesorhizobium sp. M1A.F.Ca.ET.072.01.1.1]|uniref:class I SAM-dependent methyltransferase n=1 Tax=Mesorhizobium sp. M1A.F.Ca.ET.072.01.1.1 TaxID=2496753 RepID=UPI000FD3B62A|nr:methyltransferase domain-containing protein [Mesorhizobium sp. M1A.F.Ca.ET.072.01.1.1]RUW53258.1 methyltransferase domain-containing protein [Mesorhizobium sp. M1A.F.Ca.ET.072.01.1.1]TIV03989.1 MAG: methyltransferase domain-containing protein [Mesorhizobium sp.]